MKFLLILAALVIAVSAEGQCEAEKKFVAVRAQILKSLGKEGYEFSERAKCIQSQFFGERHEQLAEKVKVLRELFESHAERRKEIMEDPTKIRIEKFTEMCPVVRQKVTDVIAVVNEAIQFCRGENAEAHPFLPALVEKWFDYFCNLNKDQLVTLISRRSNECYISKREELKKCFLDNFDITQLETIGFCGLNYKAIFECSNGIFNQCSSPDEPNLGSFFLNFFTEQCGLSQNVNTV